MAERELSVLDQVRLTLKKSGMSEAQLSTDHPAVKELFSRLQDLREEMNEAKKKAAADAAVPYLEAMTKIERQYAMLIRLSATNNDTTRG
jgi:acyl-[acyl carrier protein]--UDP-N-acetylglucosamine O-acyltransferase